MFDIDWGDLFIPGGSLLELVIRGSLIYLALFIVMRVIPRRTIGQASASDLLIIVLIADAVQNGMAAEYRSITEAAVLAGVIFGWALVIDWLDHRFPHWQLAAGKPLALVEDGKLLEKNMNRQLITEDELMAQIRMHGLDSLRNVRKAYIEGDGHFTVLLSGGIPVQRPPESRKRS
jgi:uncharacterized membrane protein YcaP (DUF421 family)